MKMHENCAVGKSNAVGFANKSGGSSGGFDIDAACRHLAALAMDDEVFLFAAIPDRKARKNAAVSHRYGTLSAAAPWVREQQAKGCGVFVTVQAMKGKVRKADEVESIRVVFAELDGGLPDRWPLESSLVIETSPGRFHVYWLIDLAEPLSAADFAGIMARMVETYGSDSNAKDLARVLRLAGTMNFKRAEAFRVRIIYESDVRYGRKELLRAFPPPAPKVLPRIELPPRSTPAGPADDAMMKRYRAYFDTGFNADLAAFRAMAPNSGRNAAAHRLGARWGYSVAHGLIARDRFIDEVLAACADNGLSAEDGIAQCRTTIENGLKKAAGDPLPVLEDRPPKLNGHAPPPKVENPVISSGVFSWPEVTNGGRPRGKSLANVTAFLKHRGVTLRRNEFTLRDEITRGGRTTELTDADVIALRLEAHAVGLDTQREFFEDVISDTARRSAYHPVREYLGSLKWDGTPRVDRWLPKYAGASDSELTRAMGRKTLLAAVRRIRSPGCKYDQALILEGPQGAGKSTLVRILASDTWFTDSVNIGAEPKQLIEQTAGTWLVEMAELSGIRKGEVEAIKAMMSRQRDRARLSYGKRAVDIPRQFVLFGTVNDSEYLRDTTGNRRFWPVKVGQMDLAGLQRDRDQIWAEAAHIEATGERLDLPEELWAAAEDEQAKRLVVDPWAETIEPALDGKRGHIAIEALWGLLDVKGGQRDGNLGRRLAQIMVRLGYHRRKITHPQKGRIYAYTNDPGGRWLYDPVPPRTGTH